MNLRRATSSTDSYAVFALTIALLFARASAHDTPAQLPDSQSAGEAWNVIEAASANVDELFAAGLLRDVTFQIANLGNAIQWLDAHAADQPNATTIHELAPRSLAEAADVITSIRDRTEPFETTKAKWKAYRKTMTALEACYTPETIHAAVFICSMHPMDRHLSSVDKCSICGMSLIRRHLPASSVYEKPGEPSMQMAVIAEPLVVGQRADVRIRLTRRDGSQVLMRDLVEMHTQKIHLLINDHSLGDYHHEHPTPTDTPGEYRFAFTPTKPGPYRIWADVVPGDSSVQEYVVGDIPASAPSAEEIDRKPTLVSVVDGRTYTLAFNTAGGPIHAGQTVIGTIEVTGRDGKPCVELEPVMGAFAHIVGFSDDQKTVLHIHPFGKQPTPPSDRAGPAFAFKFYVPTPGFLRLYGQVQIGGVAQFAPFGLTILPAEQPATRP